MFWKQRILLLMILLSHGSGQNVSGIGTTPPRQDSNGVATTPPGQASNGVAITPPGQDGTGILTTPPKQRSTEQSTTSSNPDLDTQNYYNSGNRPEPGIDYYQKADFYDGIRVDEFAGISDVNLCINTFGAGAHTCIGRCGKTSGDTLSLTACSCDAECYRYNECCPDYEIECEGWQPPTTSTDNPTTTIASSATSTILATTSQEDNLTVTTDESTTTKEPYYISRHNVFFDKFDMVLTNIPDIVRNRLMNKNVAETCTNITVVPDYLYFMVTTCPDNSSTEAHELCSDKSELNIPVYSHKDSLFYVNTFCAICNGQTGDKLEYVNVNCEWICSKHTSPYAHDAPRTLQECEESDCFSVKLSFNPQPRLCDLMVTNCPLVEADPVSKACHSYSAPVFGRNGSDVIYYKNAHCAHCNGISGTYNPTCRPSRSRGGIVQDDPSASNSGVPLTVLFDFSSGALQQSGVSGASPDPLDCPEHFIYIRSWHKCRRVSCPSGSFLYGQTCTLSADHYQTNRTVGAEFDLLYRKTVIKLARKDDNVTDDQILSEVRAFWGYYTNVDYYSIKRSQKRDNASDELWLDWDGDHWVKSDNIEKGESCLEDYKFLFAVTLEGEASRYLTNMERGINSIKNRVANMPSCNPRLKLDVVLVQVNYYNFPHPAYLCNSSVAIPKAYGERSFSRMEVMGIQKIQLEFADNKTYNSSHVAQEVIFTGGEIYLDKHNRERGNWSKMERIYFCKETPACPLIPLLPNEYQWQFDTDDTASLVFLNMLKMGRQVVNSNETVVTYDGHVHICLVDDGFYQAHIFYAYSSGQTLVTTIGCSISITLLALVIITYCTFSTLRNVPGKTVLNLSSSLFLAQLLLLVGAGQTTYWRVCLTIACVMHFFWLSVFSWTNILAFDLAQTFGKKASMRGDANSGSLFSKYSVYGWGFPFFIVGATVMLHFFQDNERILGNLYGIQYSCWLQSGYPVLFAFGVPVAIALLINIVFFARTVHGIRSTMKMALILKKEHDENDDLEFLKKELNLYIRLSVSIGLTWISGFIIPYTGVAELGYLFIILNSLQGPVIFLSFICSRRVMKLWSNKLGSSVSIFTSSMDRSTTGSVAVSRTMQTQVNGRSAIYEDRNV